jgi:hypothetical protein
MAKTRSIERITLLALAAVSTFPQTDSLAGQMTSPQTS